ncbi:MAG: hypothetical protein IPJ65_18225 [Archangiaceae bacterium]|nr:hypothetical protein [Archangiaceae bacterium]
MTSRALVSFAVFAVLLDGCNCTKIEVPEQSPLSSFDVKTLDFYLDNVGIPQKLPVVEICADRYGGDSAVPNELRGTKDCPYAMARGEIQISVQATALDLHGQPAKGFNGPVSFRVVPGDLTGDYAFRWAPADGGTALGTLKTNHQYGQVRVWAEHAPPKLIYSDGGYGGSVDQLPKDPVPPEKWTYATGLSPIVYFEEPTLARLQIPDDLDNRSSPLVGEFLTIGKRPESGSKQLQSCTNDPARDGQVVKMVVTGTDPTGFFVTDVTACRQVEEATARPHEPLEACVGGKCEVSQLTCSSSAQCKRYGPGTFGHMFIYNYSFPDGLDTGDLLWTLSGSVQEFTSTTQLTFPSWTIAERVHMLPQTEWNKYLDQVAIVDITGRMCGIDDAAVPFLTDSLCGHNKRNLKMEANESGMVRVRNVRFPKVFVNCDQNSDGTVPFFCEQTDSTGKWIWGSCAFGEVEPELDRVERTCNHDCVVGLNQYSDTICSEESTFVGFGQFVVELTPPGYPGGPLDSSLSARYQELSLSSALAAPVTPYAAGSPVVLACNAPAHFRFGDGTAVDDSDPVVVRDQLIRHTLQPGETKVAVVAEGTVPADARCSISIDPRIRINLITKDALPDLQPNCREDDSDATKAANCHAMHEATFDVVGHLRQVQPARPRWVILPRDADDVCCHPGPGLACPKPIKQCGGLSP